MSHSKWIIFFDDFLEKFQNKHYLFNNKHYIFLSQLCFYLSLLWDLHFNTYFWAGLWSRTGLVSLGDLNRIIKKRTGPEDFRNGPTDRQFHNFFCQNIVDKLISTPSWSPPEQPEIKLSTRLCHCFFRIKSNFLWPTLHISVLISIYTT